MKTLRNQKDQDLAIELLHLIAERKEAAKREKELKEYFIGKAASSNFLKVGDVILTFTEEERTSLDKKALIAEYGKEVIEAYTLTTSYIKTIVKGA